MPAKDEQPESQLIAMLHKIQMHFGYLPRPSMTRSPRRLQVPTATVSGVASFYHFFRLTPKGRYAISVCMGTACFVKGADKILEAFQTELGIASARRPATGCFPWTIALPGHLRAGAGDDHQRPGLQPGHAAAGART